MNDAPPKSRIRQVLRFLFNMAACAAILAGAVFAIIEINRTEPKAQQITATRKSAALVETITVERGTWSPTLVVLGTVEPARDIILSPRVQGQVMELAESLVPGGMVKEGDLLLKIDPADFENTLSIRQSELAQTQSSLEIEQGRQSLARKELELLEGTIGETNRALVLRVPQLASIKAEVAAAQAAMERAQLDLDRTTIFAPFDAQILTQSVNVGSQVRSGDELARLVGVREYWIRAAIPVRNLQWIQFPEGDQNGSLVTLRNPDAWPEGAERQARVTRMIGSLDRQTRLARILITVTDPLSQQSDLPPLILDSLLETRIQGRPIEDVVRLDREYVRNRNTVWVMKDDKLDVRDIDIVFQDADYAYIRDGLQDGDEVVITTLATVADGVGLKKLQDADVETTGSEDVESEETGE